MALQRIAYENKTALLAQPAIANINKISDTDMNEIKTVVNAICDATDSNTTNINGINTKITNLENKTTIKAIIDVVYPVGSIYISKDSTNPGTLWPGTTWEREAEGRCIIGIGTGYPTVGVTGGSSTIDLSHTHTSAAHTHTTGNHTLTIAEMPNHTHTINRPVWYNSEGATSDGAIYGTFASTTHLVTNTGSILHTGGSGAHNHGNTGSTTPGNTGTSLSSITNIMQPYIVMYIWRRTV